MVIVLPNRNCLVCVWIYCWSYNTLNKFIRGGEYNISSSINTKIYGMAQFKKGKIAAFRHVLTPNVSFTYNPSFADEKYGFYL